MSLVKLGGECLQAAEPHFSVARGKQLGETSALKAGQQSFGGEYAER